MNKEQITELLSNQQAFKILISSNLYMNTLTLAIGDFINIKELLTLYFIEGLSEKELSEYYNVSGVIIEDWLGKVFRITNALINKNIIRFK